MERRGGSSTHATMSSPSSTMHTPPSPCAHSQPYGVAATGVRLLATHAALDPVAAPPHRPIMLQRVGAAVSLIEREDAANYERAAVRGRVLVTVYASTPDRVSTAHVVLNEHGGRAMRYYDHWTIAELLKRSHRPGSLPQVRWHDAPHTSLGRARSGGGAGADPARAIRPRP
jgi:hypothetical protein